MTATDVTPGSAVLLSRVVQALLECEGSIARIEDLVMRLTPLADGMSEKLSLQEIDLVRQRLGDIAACLAQLAESHRRNEPVDLARILAPLKLEDLRLQLSGTQPTVRVAQDDCVLF